MLEQMRDSSGSVIIWVLFAIIIAAFVLFFGSPSDSLGCGSKNDYALSVDGEEVSVNSWRFAYNGIPYVIGNVPADQRRPMALELLLQREILAQAAEKLDFRVSTKLVNEAIQNGAFHVMGQELDGSNFYFNKEDPELPYFEYEYLENLVKGRLGLPNIASYKGEQRREILAAIMKQELVQSAYVSEEEARQNFIMANTTISVEYVKFEISKYRAAIALSEAEVQSYADTHTEELKTEWEQVKPRWEGDKDRVKARIIRIARANPKAAATPANEGDEAAAGEAPASEEPDAEPPVAVEPEVIDPGRIKIDELRAKIVAGADFSQVAMESSEDGSATLGGYIGWRPTDSMGFGPEVVAATKDLAVAKVSEVIESNSDYYLVLIEERSAKGLSFDQKKFDLAIKAAPDSIARDRARQAAEKALAMAATTPLSELFTPATPSTSPTIDLDNLPPEIRQQLTPEQLQKLMESAVPKSESGAIVMEGRNRYAQLGGDEQPAEPKPPTATPPTTKPATAAPATAAPTAKPAPAKSATPPPASAKPANATPASTKPLVPAAGAETPADSHAVTEAATEGDGSVPAPPLQKVVGTTRNGDFIAGLGRSKDLVNDLFGVLAVDSLATKVYSVGETEGFVVIRLNDRNEADMERFKEEAANLQASLAEAKGGELLQKWVAQKCLALKKSGAIKANQTLLVSGSDNKRIAYEPCSYLIPGK